MPLVIGLICTLNKFGDTTGGKFTSERNGTCVPLIWCTIVITG